MSLAFLRFRVFRVTVIHTLLLLYEHLHGFISMNIYTYKMLMSLYRAYIYKECIASLWAVTDNKIIEVFSMG